jgi:Arc/MetJ-type ribon-helix-helix transcriptional regulator
MSEEAPFKSIKITLSEEAIEKLCELRQGGSFRSDSAAIEECIRAMSDMYNELESSIKSHRINGGKTLKDYSSEERYSLIKSLIIRVARFGKTLSL